MKTLPTIQKYFFEIVRAYLYALRRSARYLWRPTLVNSIILSMLSPAFAFGQPIASNTLPTGAQVAAGQAAVSQTGSRMSIQQSTDKAIINWGTFNIGSAASVNFNQPSSSSVALNRVISSSPSIINGQLTANGKIFLINPDGVIFGRGSSVNVGAFVASTMNMKDSDFLSGNYNFARDGSTGKIINHGTITAADGGYIAMLAPEVRNGGIIQARMGTIAMAGGDAVTLDMAGDNLINVRVDPATVSTLIDNRHLIEADGGTVIMSNSAADQLLGSAISNSGVIQAQTVDNSKGTIMLLGDMQNGTVKNSGTLDASAPNGGDGGFIETSAAHVHAADTARVTTLAPYGKAGMWLIDPDGYTIAATGGDISGSTLSSNLNSGNVSIASTSGSGSDGNVNVNDTVSWSANKLTLTATNNVNINAVMTASGSASLDLEPGSKQVNVGRNTDGVFTGRVDFPGRSGTGFLTINGNGYTVINSLGAQGSTTGTDLQGISGGLSGLYALGSNIDASATSGWNSGLGFAPIGSANSAAGAFTGVFNGLGHTISGLFIDNTSNNSFIGLFGVLRNNGTGTAITTNVGLTNANISGGGTSSDVGALVGLNNAGSISNSYSTGTVSAGSSAGSNNIGGLVGKMLGNSSITGSYSGAAVSSSGSAGSNNVGGLVGQNNGNGSISDSYATGAVSTSNGNGDSLGGLVGQNTGNGSISNSFFSAAGTVKTTNSAGGDNVGGLVGNNSGNSSISDSFSTGAVGTNNSGGIDNVGGLVGNNSSSNSSISESYSSGAVSTSGSGGGDSVGGLAGNNSGTISNSFWDKTTSGQTLSDANNDGEGIGLTTAQMMTVANFNSATAANNNTNPGWSISQSGTSTSSQSSGSTIWVIYNGQTYPLLEKILTPLTITPSATTTYNGLAWAGAGESYSTSLGTVNSNAILGTTTYSATAQNAGTYPLTVSGLYSVQLGYDITFASGTLTINKASLSVTANNASKTYNGLAFSGGNGVVYSGFVNSETSSVLGGTLAYGGTSQNAINAGSYSIIPSGYTSGNYTITYTNGTLTVNRLPVTLTGTRTYDATTTAASGILSITNTLSGDNLSVGSGSGTLASKNAGSESITSFGTLALSGTDAGNYTLTGASGSVTVNALAVNLTGSRTYDATSTAASGILSVSNTISGDSLSVASGSGTLASKNAGSESITSFGTLALSGTDAGNYTLTGASGSVTINKAALTVTASSNTKTYDGTTTASATPTVSGLQTGDTATGLSEAYTDKNSGTGKTLSVAAYTINDSNNGNNYTVTTQSDTTGVVNKAALSVTANNDSKTYSGSAYSGGNGVAYSGLVNSETSSVLGGTLTYGGTAQGAVNAGSYTITPLGLTAVNYVITFINGILTITSLPVVTNTGTTTASNSTISNVTTTTNTTANTTTNTRANTNVNTNNVYNLVNGNVNANVSAYLSGTINTTPSTGNNTLITGSGSSINTAGTGYGTSSNGCSILTKGNTQYLTATCLLLQSGH